MFHHQRNSSYAMLLCCWCCAIVNSSNTRSVVVEWRARRSASELLSAWRAESTTSTAEGCARQQQWSGDNSSRDEGRADQRHGHAQSPLALHKVTSAHMSSAEGWYPTLAPGHNLTLEFEPWHWGCRLLGSQLVNKFSLRNSQPVLVMISIHIYFKKCYCFK